MKYIKIFIMLILFSTFSLALSENDIGPLVKDITSKSIIILKDKTLIQDAKAQKMFVLFDKYFDYDIMAKLSLSKYYNTLSLVQQKQFEDAHEKRLKKSFIENLAYYSNQGVKTAGISKPNLKRIFSTINIIGEEKNYPIVFKFYPKDESNWIIYDVDILGVSLIQTNRS